MTQYFRVTAYHAETNISVIMDSNGLFEKLWQFSSHLVNRGFKILEAGTDEKFIDINIAKAEPEPEKLILRAYHNGMPNYEPYQVDGKQYNAVKIGEKCYIPDKGVM